MCVYIYISYEICTTVVEREWSEDAGCRGIEESNTPYCRNAISLCDFQAVLNSDLIPRGGFIVYIITGRGRVEPTAKETVIQIYLTLAAVCVKGNIIK